MFETKILDDFNGYGKCLYITNGVVDLAATIDVGPRIVRYGYVGESNIMLNDNKTCPFLEPQTSDEMKRYYGDNAAFYLRGGHRLWVSPEYYPETYYPDNNPVEYEILENGIVLTPPPQIENQLQMRITITLSEGSSDVELKHEVINTAKHNQTFAAWALSMCAPGGVEIVKMNTYSIPYLPNANITLWPFSQITDDSVYFGKKYFTLANPANGSTKYGFGLEHGDTYYVLGDTVFINKFTPKFPNGTYPDNGASYETFSCPWFTEMETLSETTTLAPNESIVHRENWALAKKPCDFNRKDEASIENFLNQL